MENSVKLSSILPGQYVYVTGLRHNREMNRRFRDLGLIEGTLVECLHQSPWGSPAAYLIRGAVIAIRKQDADMVCVTPYTTDNGKVN